MTSISSIKQNLNRSTLIDGGYGEHIVYKTDSNTSSSPHLDQTTYQQCYQVLLQAKHVTVESEKREFLKRELTQIDPNIKAFFIPRTLYELCFIQKSIKEVLRLGTICKNTKFARIDRPETKCWHGAYFRDFGDDQDEIVIDLAYRLNNSIVRNLAVRRIKTFGPLCYEQITSIANEKLAFLNSCHQDSRSNISIKLSEIVTASNSCGGITANMIDEYQGGSCKPLGIQTEKMKELVLNIIALECSNVAKGKLILYRGSKVLNDKPLKYGDNGKVNLVQSLSYGTGPFSGGEYDPGAAAFYYIRQGHNDASAILIPQEEAATSTFAIPITHPICQMFGRGEKWHARSRAPTIDVNPEVKIGCKGGPCLGEIGNVPSHFQLAVTPQQFEEKFQYYMKNCVVNLKA